MNKLTSLFAASLLSVAATQASADIVYELEGTCDGDGPFCGFTGIGGGSSLIGNITVVDGADADNFIDTTEVISVFVGGGPVPELVAWVDGGDTMAANVFGGAITDFLWHSLGGPFEADITFAADENGPNDGSILVNGSSFSADSSFTTSAVPVPASAWLFGSAMLGLVGVGRKRRA